MIDLDRDWVKRARCKSTSTRRFFVPTGKESVHALRVCNQCQVKTICYCYALIRNERGIWGGTTEQERDARRPHILDVILDLWPDLTEKERDATV